MKENETCSTNAKDLAMTTVHIYLKVIHLATSRPRRVASVKGAASALHVYASLKSENMSGVANSTMQSRLMLSLGGTAVDCSDLVGSGIVRRASRLKSTI